MYFNRKHCKTKCIAVFDSLMEKHDQVVIHNTPQVNCCISTSQPAVVFLIAVLSFLRNKLRDNHDLFAE